MFDIISVAILLIAIDSGFVGFLSTFLKLSPPIREIHKEDIIIHGRVSRVQYNTTNKWINFRINNVAGIKLILTKQYLYIQDRILSYATKLPVIEMKQFSMMESDLVGKVFGDRIEINTKSGRNILFRTDEIEAWKNALLELGISDET